VSKTFTFKDYTKKYNNEVHFTNNKDEPFYRWYPFVEGFSGNLVKSIVGELDYIPTLCLDPFAGSGTTPLACQDQAIMCISFEVNPFLVDLMKVKLYRGYDLRYIEDTIDRFELNLKKSKLTPDYPEIDPQTLFEKDGLKRWIFHKEVAWGIFDVLDEIESLPKDSIYPKLLFKIALSSNLLSISNVFRNGKCLSYKPNWQNNRLSREDVHKKFLDFCRNVILDDLRNVKSGEITVENHSLCARGDARELVKNLDDNSIDLVITSPPYLNSRDYTDIYRLELWVLGYLKSYADQRQLRKSTLRSHVQIVWGSEKAPEIADLTEALNRIEKHRDKFWNKSIPEMISGYFADMNTILRFLKTKLKSQSKVYIDIGNSSYYNVAVETDAITAQIAEKHGFNVDEIRIARYLRSSGQQDSAKLREGVIVLSKT
jgi:DNA modification methylase